jgi:HSP20 family protein
MCQAVAGASSMVTEKGVTKEDDMANLIRGNRGGSVQRDPFSLARELLGWDPYYRVDWPARDQAATGNFAPHFNVIERGDSYFITADLPGVRDEDVDVTVQDSYLVVSGSRSAEERKEGDNYYLYERRYGNFSRAFALPENADPDSVEAELKNGVLELKIGKRESARPRKIPLGQRVREKLGMTPEKEAGKESKEKKAS